MTIKQNWLRDVTNKIRRSVLVFFSDHSLFADVFNVCYSLSEWELLFERLATTMMPIVR